MVLRCLYFSTAAAYYAEVKKQEDDTDPKPWKSLTADEKKPYIEALNHVSQFVLISKLIEIFRLKLSILIK
jgi:hypothetical protein